MPSDAHVEFVLVSARVGCSLGIALGIQIIFGITCTKAACASLLNLVFRCSSSPSFLGCVRGCLVLWWMVVGLTLMVVSC